MKLSVIIPAFNEETRIIPTLAETAEFLKKNDVDSELIVVDDGSTDATEFVTNDALSKTKIPYKVIRHSTNLGKGAAIATGIKNSKGDYILFLDADGSASIKELVRFYEHIDPTVLLVGSRRINESLLLIDQGRSRKFLGKLAQIFHQIFFRLGIKDTQCGFKLMPKSLAISFIRKDYPKGWGFDIGLIDYAQRCGFKVKEIAIAWKDVPGNKISVFVDSFKTARELLAYKINSFRKK